MFVEPLTATVLMAVYNDRFFIQKALDSIVQQLSPDMELLIIDDFSSDGSEDIINNISSTNSQIRIIRNDSNRGLGYCLALGTQEAKGQYVIRMDSDDICLPDRFIKQINFLNQNPDVDIIGGWAIEIDEHDNPGRLRKMPASHRKIQSSIWACPLIHPTVAFRKDKILLAGNYRHQSSRRQEDYELWFRCLKEGLQFANLEEPLIYYRFTPKSQSKQRLSHAIHQVRIGWHGCRLLRLPWWYYLAVTAPILRAIFPPKLSHIIYRSLSLFDPRKK